MRNIVVFASGSGSNAENIVRFFNDKPGFEVVSILCNRPNAGVLGRARALKVNTMVFDRTMFYDSDDVLDYLNKLRPDLIVLAGFLWLVPEKMVQAFPDRIINIHPALLPKYGGKGMYGDKVHQAVIESGDSQSGITIHYVNNRYDEGNAIFQARCEIEKNDTPESLAGKIHQLEYAHFPRVIHDVLLKMKED